MESAKGAAKVVKRSWVRGQEKGNGTQTKHSLLTSVLSDSKLGIINISGS